MTGTYALRDSTTMLRRNLRHLQRYPGLSLFPILGPVVFLLLFVYVFGGTLGNGITTGGGRGAYINFLTPGILLFTVVGAAKTTAMAHSPWRPLRADRRRRDRHLPHRTRNNQVGKGDRPAPMRRGH